MLKPRRHSAAGGSSSPAASPPTTPHHRPKQSSTTGQDNCRRPLGARATVFHAITTFREMTDHYGLEPEGIFRFTREIPNHGLLSTLLHPHHNGYHLTHHLFPAVPYHQLPRLHAQLMTLDDYAGRALVCHSYLKGSRSSVIGWGTNHG
ncbi:fatty acid desaturase [Paraburkholderia xenovorans]|uniref:fatty acid desaturase n=1 Tax=Paraburkholderia xenovorans TaxID=36873 RepID=UPI0022772235|nr:fatty acid desaturase [Paraburkholderia xenovorans]